VHQDPDSRRRLDGMLQRRPSLRAPLAASHADTTDCAAGIPKRATSDQDAARTGKAVLARHARIDRVLDVDAFLDDHRSAGASLPPRRGTLSAVTRERRGVRVPIFRLRSNARLRKRRFAQRRRLCQRGFVHFQTIPHVGQCRNLLSHLAISCELDVTQTAQRRKRQCRKPRRP
jgi:hypothetical protein